ncbi:hypothetical protein [Streptomonospora salina]|uniref:Uncharacterized protein n=1 Tax=Streptomonospora salina TaxID=104205 RepID=A0A841EAJ3_9ACTN|nr:hypothetical protein [Streptomonospora salina]MBB6000135.1 hypothetical protein [Streptomonospora salina]
MEHPVTLDETTGYDRTQSYSYTRVADLGGRRVRARIHRDYYPVQSHAVAEVLSDARTWTHLAQADPSGWHADTPDPPSGVDARRELAPLADRLIDRAAAILA